MYHLISISNHSKEKPRNQLLLDPQPESISKRFDLKYIDLLKIIIVTK